MTLYFMPFFLQGVALFFDEFYFHRKRGLPAWERIGHPLDTLTVFVCYLYIHLAPATSEHLNVFVGLCVISCLFVTKDEFIHTQYCEAKENWLHAVLFLLHPITFLAAGFIWMNNLNPIFLLIQPVVIFCFAIYQFLYWRFFAKS